MEAEEAISRLKAKYGVTTDQELAKALFLGKSTVGAWRSRGGVPERYIRALESDRKEPASLIIAEMTEEEHLALSLAILRMIRDFSSVVTDNREFLAHGTAMPNILMRYYEEAIEDFGISSDEFTKEKRDYFNSWATRFNVKAFDEFFSKD
ncbi:helix-turn-helix domain-containing protein [Roseinatronobacter sp.]|uniref:helix-turn-helix domain-containing protein n=1 Tax=Roseinatronobacter sp. TaxID=1945755 RepID=UPI0025D7B505|nr:helix-turn-helix domain-containing protein [Roseibaca sp.]